MNSRRSTALYLLISFLAVNIHSSLSQGKHIIIKWLKMPFQLQHDDCPAPLSVRIYPTH